MPLGRWQGRSTTRGWCRATAPLPCPSLAGGALPCGRTPIRGRARRHAPQRHQFPGADPALAGVLEPPGLRPAPAVRHGNGCRHVPSRHHAARAGAEAVARRLCAAQPPPDRRPLRRKPQPGAALLPVPGHHEAQPGERAGAAAGQLPRARPGPAAPRLPLRRGRLGKPDPRRLGPRLGGMVRRHGGRASSPISSRSAASRSRCRASR